MTQEEKIKNYMEEKGSITTMQAFIDLGITRLAARVCDLRSHGVNVSGVYETHNGKTYMRYKIVR